MELKRAAELSICSLLKEALPDLTFFPSRGGTDDITPDWAPDHYYSVGDILRPKDHSKVQALVVTKPGHGGSTEPTWTDVVGNVIHASPASPTGTPPTGWGDTVVVAGVTYYWWSAGSAYTVTGDAPTPPDPFVGVVPSMFVGSPTSVIVPSTLGDGSYVEAIYNEVTGALAIIHGYASLADLAMGNVIPADASWVPSWSSGDYDNHGHWGVNFLTIQDYAVSVSQDSSTPMPPFGVVYIEDAEKTLAQEETSYLQGSVVWVTRADATHISAHSRDFKRVYDALCSIGSGYDIMHRLMIHGIDITKTDEFSDGGRQCHGDVVSFTLGCTEKLFQQ